MAELFLLDNNDPIPWLRPNYDPLVDYEDELIYRYQMYPDEIPARKNLKDTAMSFINKAQETFSAIRDVRDEIYGYNKKGNGGIHLKSTDDMEFLPGGIPSMNENQFGFGNISQPDFSLQANDKRGDVIKEVHHYHGNKKKKGKARIVVKRVKDEPDNDIDFKRFADPTYVPKSLKKLF